MARRRYTEADKATALAVLKARGNDLSKAARDTDIPRTTLQRWQSEPRNAAPLELRQQKERDAAGAWSELRDLALDRARATVLDDSQKIQFRDLSWTAAVATDKVQLLTGKPTERTEVLSLADFLRGSTPVHKPLHNGIETVDRLHNPDRGAQTIH